MTLTNQGNINLYVPQGSLYFDGNNDYVTVGSNRYELLCSGAITASVWMKTDNASQANNDSIISRFRWFISQTAVAGIYAFRIYNEAGTLYAASSNVSLANDRWHHVVGTFDSAVNEVKLYVDGELENTLTTSGKIDGDVKNYDVKMGVVAGALGDWNGNINEARIYSGTALTADEVKKIYNGINVTNNLVGHWKFDEKKGAKIVDEIYSITGAITNAVWQDRDIRCWNSRFDISNYNSIIETFIDACDRNYLFDNITPGACRELYNILGTPKFIDTTFTSSNSLRISPIGGTGLSGLREERVICVKNAQSSFINPETYGIKIEGVIL